jgi:hypothetical protein
MMLTRFLLLLSFLLCETGVDSLAAKSKTTGKANGGGFGVVKQNPLVHTPDTSETTQRLLQFLTAQQAKGLKDVEIGHHQSTGVRGFFCTKNFKKGQIMFKIPSDCALALSDPSKNGEDVPTLTHGGANFLSMYWNNEEARQLWAPYLDALPVQGSSQFDPTPDFFEEEEIELLEFPRLIRQVKERKEEIVQIAAEKGIDVAELQFATWLTASRAFRISISTDSDDDEMPKYDKKNQVIAKREQNTVRVMVPFIDMVNHSSDNSNAKLTLIDPEKDDAWFALEATRNIPAGKEILIAYGTGVDSSAELLLNYGFVPQSNRIDQFMLKKGGDDCITSLDGWTTTLEEDKAMLPMAEDDDTLKKILKFRIQMKESYVKAK